MSRLDHNERELLEAFEAGEFKRAPSAADIQKRHREDAEAIFKKGARINIRLSSKDLSELQKKGPGRRDPLPDSGRKHSPQTR